MKQKKKICLAIPSLYVGGGAESSTRRLYHEMKKEYQVSLVTLHESVVPEEVTSFGFSDSPWAKVFCILKQAKKVSQYCRANDIDTLICNLPRMNTIGVLSRLLYGNSAQLILVTRNANPGKKINYLCIKFLWRYADWNVSVSRGGTEMLSSWGLKNTKTIHNVFDFEKIDRLLQEDIEERDTHLFARDKQTLITIGRLHKQKGHEYLIDGFTQYHQTNPNSQLILLYGDDTLHEYLAKKIQSYNMEEHVHLVGKRENVFPYLKRSDVFLLSSLYEGLPTVLIEAGYVGIPIVAADCVSGPREILQNQCPYNTPITYPYYGQGGVIIDPATSIHFAESLCETLEQIKNGKMQSTCKTNVYGPKHIMALWKSLL